MLTILILFLTVFTLLKNRSEIFFREKQPQPFSKIKSTEIVGLSIQGEATNNLILRKNNHWYVRKDGEEFPADEERINNLIQTLISLSKTEIASKNKNRHRDLGVGKKNIAIKTNAENYLLYIGSSASLTKNYIRLNDENEVFIAEGLENVFSPEDYRDLSLRLIANENDVNYASINFNGQTTILNKKGNNWLIAQKQAKKDRVDFFLNDAKTVKANDILSKKSFDQALSYPNLSLQIKEKGAIKTVDFFQKDQNNYWATTSLSDYIFQVPVAYIEYLKKEEKDFVD